MSRENKFAPEQIVLERTETEWKGQIHTEWKISGRTDSEESDIRCHAAKQVVEQHFKDGIFEEAYQKVKMIEAVLITMKENDLITIDQALESIRLASSISAYLCKDGIYAKRAVGHRPEEHKSSGGGWGDGLNPKMICGHYGYMDVNAIQSGYHGYWPKETVLSRIAELTQVLSLMDAEKRKFRIVLDYDPEFPRALLQIKGLPTATLPPDKGSQLEK